MLKIRLFLLILAFCSSSSLYSMDTKKSPDAQEILSLRTKIAEFLQKELRQSKTSTLSATTAQKIVNIRAAIELLLKENQASANDFVSKTSNTKCPLEQAASDIMYTVQYHYAENLTMQHIKQALGLVITTLDKKGSDVPLPSPKSPQREKTPAKSPKTAATTSALSKTTVHVRSRSRTVNTLAQDRSKTPAAGSASKAQTSKTTHDIPTIDTAAATPSLFTRIIRALSPRPRTPEPERPATPKAAPSTPRPTTPSPAATQPAKTPISREKRPATAAAPSAAKQSPVQATTPVRPRATMTPTTTGYASRKTARKQSKAPDRPTSPAPRTPVTTHARSRSIGRTKQGN